MLWDWKVYGLESYFAEQVREAETEANRVYEPVIGIVTDNKDPQKLGRVKLKFPVISNDDVTDWTPLVMQGAGKNRGWFFIPELDDEVLVIFEHGDIHRPLVIGGLWNGKDKPHDKNPDGDNAHRVIKSRQGSRVFFDDSDENKVYIEDGTGKGRITLDAKNNKIIIEAIDGDVCFQSPQDDTKIVAKEMVLEAKQGNIEINAGSTMTWGTDKECKINGGGGVTISGANANFNCGTAQQPAMPTATPKDVDDPSGS